MPIIFTLKSIPIILKINAVIELIKAKPRKLTRVKMMPQIPKT